MLVSLWTHVKAHNFNIGETMLEFLLWESPACRAPVLTQEKIPRLSGEQQQLQSAATRHV